jgi:ATP-dependent Lon protease
MAFVGNIDMSVEQIVNSTEYDLFQPVPEQFDLAVMDRFACYLPGWEMPKNSSAFLTGRFGLITDYLAEAFHHQLKHSNRYEEVNKRVRLGLAVEGRDEKGIKKMLCAMLKILHPADAPSDEEFDEYVAYAVECRRRVKEQMNKRKPDDEFARINLSFFDRDGKEVVVRCPESLGAPATLDPARRRLRPKAERTMGQTQAPPPSPVEQRTETSPSSQVPASTPEPEAPIERHYTIAYGDTGHSYDTIFGPYLPGAKSVVVEDRIFDCPTRPRTSSASAKPSSRPPPSAN